MGRLVMAIITIGILGYIGYKQMYGHSYTAGSPSNAKQRLDNVKKAAVRIEDQQQKSADKAYNDSETAETK